MNKAAYQSGSGNRKNNLTKRKSWRILPISVPLPKIDGECDTGSEAGSFAIASGKYCP